MGREQRTKNRRKPTALGTGLIALDVVLTGTEHVSALWAGGTCGNVLTILSFLGWRSYPLARFNGDAAAKRVSEDLARWGVQLDFASLSPSARTPVFVHRIERDRRGRPRHRFSMRCPLCDERMPSYSPVRADSVEDALKRIPKADVFFLDRVSRSALMLASAAAQSGALVYFEPSANGKPSLFQEALEIAHIVKYSHDRMSWLSDDSVCRGDNLLQIETLGQAGLRYRGRFGHTKSRTWRRLDSYSIQHVKDTGGSGDWCSAAILHKLLGHSREVTEQTNQAGLEEALQFGQAAGAWNCSFEGARGGMYQYSRRSVLRQIQAVQAGKMRTATKGDKQISSQAGHKPRPDWCSSCLSVPEMQPV